MFHLGSIFTKEDNFGDFCLLSCTKSPFENKVLSIRKEFATEGANAFLIEETTIDKGGKNIC